MDLMTNYLKILVEDMHSAIVATVDEAGRPQTRAIDMMLWDAEGVYFLTAKGKEFYRQLMEQGYIALSAVKDKKSISLRGKIRNIHQEKLEEIFEKIYTCSRSTRKAPEMHWKFSGFMRRKGGSLTSANRRM